jgi:hypothetical protein
MRAKSAAKRRGAIAKLRTTDIRQALRVIQKRFAAGDLSPADQELLMVAIDHELESVSSLLREGTV